MSKHYGYNSRGEIAVRNRDGSPLTEAQVAELKGNAAYKRFTFRALPDPVKAEDLTEVRDADQPSVAEEEDQTNNSDNTTDGKDRTRAGNSRKTNRKDS